ncbi:hypothetical protein [Candidatus Contubernalis alkaliaceticus]|uniref:hypothetical protein n=1 Tax=Candidatus Contubernalis alkaliaceticus TaxID=338645 RepID=UPI001F4C16F5|nr:hypothetical protein [Candidatus Contubernalis alkalaceticus]UNC91824.1 hypothetical protein HUE98_06770 [Candidatus Contubernalis alkalaceticus]
MRKILKRVYHTKSLITGFLVGAFFVLFLFGAVLGFISQKGVIVYIDSEEVARTVQYQVTQHTADNIPIFMDQAKKDVPQIVEEQIKGQFNSGKLEIAGFSFSLPEDFILSLEGMLKENIETGIYSIIDGMDNEELSQVLGDNAYFIVKKALEEEYRGKSFTVKPMEWLSILVTLEVEEGSASE